MYEAKTHGGSKKNVWRRAISEREAILLTALQTTKPCSILPVGKRYNFSCRWHAMKHAIVYSNREEPERLRLSEYQADFIPAVS